MQEVVKNIDEHKCSSNVSFQKLNIDVYYNYYEIIK